MVGSNETKKGEKQRDRGGKTLTQIDRLKTTHEEDGVGGQHVGSHSEVKKDLNEKRNERECQPEITLLNKED